jgi:hypothetical protein
LPLNDLTGSFGTLQSLLLDLGSSSLTIRDIFVALGALHLSRPNALCRDQSQKINLCHAITGYQTCVSSLRLHLDQATVASDWTPLWITLFLGMFEVCFLNQSALLMNILLLNLTADV